MVATLARTDTVRGGMRMLAPKWTEVLNVEPEIPGVSTYRLKLVEPEDQEAYAFEPGQFNMLYLPGYGEAAISISSDPMDHAGIAHTVRFVGNVTKAISQLRAGQLIGLRGPFGRPWPIKQL